MLSFFAARLAHRSARGRGDETLDRSVTTHGETAVIVNLSDPVAILLSSLTWMAVSFSVGYLAVRWPPSRLDRTGPITTVRSWEAGGMFWQRSLAVGRWKDRLPDAGGFFAGGQPKRSVGSRSTEQLAAFRRETVRAERVHWLILSSTPIHLVWCRPPLAAAMVVFGLALNVPFIVIQRFNRGRIDRVLARRR